MGAVSTDALIVISFTLYKVASIAAGLATCYLGYRLFRAGVWGDAGSMRAAHGNTRLVLTNAAPGTFFVVLGAAVICVALYKGEHFDWSSYKAQPCQTKPVLPEATS